MTSDVFPKVLKAQMRTPVPYEVDNNAIDLAILLASSPNIGNAKSWQNKTLKTSLSVLLPS